GLALQAGLRVREVPVHIELIAIVRRIREHGERRRTADAARGIPIGARRHDLHEDVVALRPDRTDVAAAVVATVIAARVAATAATRLRQAAAASARSEENDERACRGLKIRMHGIP